MWIKLLHLLLYYLTNLLKWCTISRKLLRTERPNFTKGPKSTNHDRPTQISPTANSITVILTNHLYKPDLDHSTNNNFSLDSHDDFRLGCRKSVITVQKQSFSRGALTQTIKLHYYIVDTIAKALGFRQALSPRSTCLKANPAQLAHFLHKKTSKSRRKDRLLQTQPSTFLN